MPIYQQITIGLAAGFGAFLALLLVVWASGSTFGQRCESMGHAGAAWEDCVHRLARGESR